jgi:hypothetical protein
MPHLIINLDNPKVLDPQTIIEKTMLCWEDIQAKRLSQKGREEVSTPKTITEQRDACGDGLPTYMLTKPRMAWKTFPVFYHVDPTNCNHKNKTEVIGAIHSSFESYNIILKKQAFALTSDRANARIKIFWAGHDGPLGQLAVCNYSYYPTKGEMISATIKFDQNDQWFKNPSLQCGYSGSLFDIENCAAHEIGHGLGLSHVFNDPLSTMYPTMKKGETLRRTLDTGTKNAVKNLYGIA